MRIFGQVLNKAGDMTFLNDLKDTHKDRLLEKKCLVGFD